MAQQTGTAVLIEGFVPAGLRCLAHRLNGVVQSWVMEQTFLYGNHPMGALGIDAALQVALWPGGKGGDGFVAVMPGVFHGKNGLHRPKAAQ